MTKYLSRKLIDEIRQVRGLYPGIFKTFVWEEWSSLVGKSLNEDNLIITGNFNALCSETKSIFESLGRLPFGQKIETGTNGTAETSWEKFQKIRKLLNFRKANCHSNENSG